MPPLTEPVSKLATYAWFILLIRAALALGLGVVILLTGEFRPGMANVIALYWLLGSLLTLRWARAHRGDPRERLAFLAGCLGLAAGGAILVRDLLGGYLAQEVLLALLGTFSIMIGFLRVSGVFRESVTEEFRRSRPEAVVLGALEIALGVTLVLSHELRPIVIPMIGVWGLVGGSIMLADAIRARRAILALRGSRG